MGYRFSPLKHGDDIYIRIVDAINLCEIANSYGITVKDVIGQLELCLSKSKESGFWK